MQEAGKPRYAVGELQPLLQPLLTALFAAFRLPESGENEYLMKAVMRVIAYVGPEVQDLSCFIWPRAGVLLPETCCIEACQLPFCTTALARQCMPD